MSVCRAEFGKFRYFKSRRHLHLHLPIQAPTLLSSNIAPRDVADLTLCMVIIMPNLVSVGQTVRADVQRYP